MSTALMHTSTVTLSLGALMGGVLVWLWMRPRLRQAQQAEFFKSENERLEKEKIALEVQLNAAVSVQEQFAHWNEDCRQMFQRAAQESFTNEHLQKIAQTMAGQLGEATNQALNQQKTALGTLLTPLKDGLNTYTEKIAALEQNHDTIQKSFADQLKQMTHTQNQWFEKAEPLTQALTNVPERGKWGEVQLERVLELAEMKEYVDFHTQPTTTIDGQERSQTARPDVIVRLPNERCIVVDAKTPAIALEREPGDNETNENYVQGLQEVAKHLRQRIDELHKKPYRNLPGTPDFVVLFVPSEGLLYQALKGDPQLIEDACVKNVMLATPTTLITLLKAVHYGWEQRQMAANLEELKQFGSELMERMGKVFEYVNALRNHLKQTEQDYNNLVGSMGERLLPTAKKFKSFSKSQTPFTQPDPLTVSLKCVSEFQPEGSNSALPAGAETVKNSTPPD